MAVTSGLFLPPPDTLSPQSLVKKNDMPSPLFTNHAPISLPKRFAVLKDRIASRSEFSLTASWLRLLRVLREDIDIVSSSKAKIIPTIDFADISSPKLATEFADSLKERGVAVIHNVVPQETAASWRQELASYISQRPETAQTPPGQESQIHDIFWSPVQIEARAHPNIITAQRFAMGTWKPQDPNAGVSTYFPVAYADRIRTQSIDIPESQNSTAHVDGGSVERWENDGYGDAGAYRKVLNGEWEEYDPWESSSRITVTSDLYRGASSCSIFRMFSGVLSLSSTTPADEPLLRVLPMPKLATAYFLLRPFFSPVSTSKDVDLNNHPSPSDWVLNSPQNSLLHGALPGYSQEINPQTHPHLQLENSLVSIPPLNPGDYVIWHPDLVHAISNTSPPGLQNSNSNRNNSNTILYLPACPLTQTNALYLSRQRKAFLLGYPGPDFDVTGHIRSSSQSKDERHHSSRAGVQEVNNAGGDDGLRAMGLLPWDEEDAESDAEREVLAMANSILFPDLFGR